VYTEQESAGSVSLLCGTPLLDLHIRPKSTKGNRNAA
jgi:hypothetical protein